MGKRQRRLGDVLLELGFVDEARLEAALAAARTGSRPLGEQLVRDGVLTEDTLVSALSRHLGVAAVDPIRTPVHPKVLAVVPRETAYAHRVIPIARKRVAEGDALFLATTDPFDDNARRAVEALLPANTLVAWLVCGASEMADGLVYHYGPAAGEGSEDVLPFADATLLAEDGEEGEPFGAYRLKRKIGSGGMAHVFLATTQGVAGAGRPLAIKRLLPRFANDEEAKKAFVGEANLCVGLRHPNIVQVHHLGDVEGTQFIAMEFVDGYDLRRVIDRYTKRQENVPLPIALRIMIEVLKGLHYCHDAVDGDEEPLGIIHRDVAPSNVLVSREGDVKLSDFGIAHSQFATSTEEGGHLRGTFRYRAPEQLANRVIDRRADVFCAGLVLFELFTGQPLFGGDEDDAQRTVRTLDSDLASRIRHQRDDLDPALEVIFERALATRSDERYQTADELREALSAYAESVGATVTTDDVAAMIRALDEEDGRAVTYPKPRPKYVPDITSTIHANALEAADRVQRASPRLRLAVIGAAVLAAVVAVVALSPGGADEDHVPVRDESLPPLPAVIEDESPSSHVHTERREVLPGRFEEPAPEGHAFIAHATALERRADGAGVVRELRAGELVRRVLEVDSKILVLVVPAGPAGFVPADVLTDRTPTDAFVNQMNEGRCTIGRKQTRDDCLFRAKQRFDLCLSKCPALLGPFETVESSRCGALCRAAFDDCLGRCNADANK